MKAKHLVRWGAAAGSCGEYVIWQDGRQELRGNSGAFLSGMAGDGVNHRQYGEFSEEAQQLLTQASRERAEWASLPGEVLNKSIHERFRRLLLVELKCGLGVEMTRPEAQFRVQQGEVALVAT